MDTTFKKKNIWLRQTRLSEKDLQIFPNVDKYMKEKDVNQLVVAII
jgi:hypothetical protein